MRRSLAVLRWSLMVTRAACCCKQAQQASRQPRLVQYGAIGDGGGEDAGKRFIANMSLDVAQDLVSMKLDLNDMEGSVATDEDGKCSFALDGAAAKL